MFAKAELEQLRPHKELLVLQSNAHRLLLAAEWQRLQSPEFWQAEASRTVRKHPWVTAALGVGVGVVALKALRHPGGAVSWLGRLTGTGSTLLSIWNLLGRK